MSVYKKMYLNLFNRVTDAINILQESTSNSDFKNLITRTINAIQILQDAHVKSENIYIETFSEKSPVQSTEAPASDDI